MLASSNIFQLFINKCTLRWMKNYQTRPRQLIFKVVRTWQVSGEVPWEPAGPGLAIWYETVKKIYTKNIFCLSTTFIAVRQIKVIMTINFWQNRQTVGCMVKKTREQRWREGSSNFFFSRTFSFLTHAFRSQCIGGQIIVFVLWPGLFWDREI